MSRGAACKGHLFASAPGSPARVAASRPAWESQSAAETAFPNNLARAWAYALTSRPIRMRKGRDIVPGERPLHLPQDRERIAGTLERVTGLGHIRGHVAFERLDGFKLLLMPDPPDERDINGL